MRRRPRAGGIAGRRARLAVGRRQRRRRGLPGAFEPPEGVDAARRLDGRGGKEYENGDEGILHARPFLWRGVLVDEVVKRGVERVVRIDKRSKRAHVRCADDPDNVGRSTGRHEFVHVDRRALARLRVVFGSANGDRRWRAGTNVEARRNRTAQLGRRAEDARVDLLECVRSRPKDPVRRRRPRRQRRPAARSARSRRVRGTQRRRRAAPRFVRRQSGRRERRFSRSGRSRMRGGAPTRRPWRRRRSLRPHRLAESCDTKRPPSLNLGARAARPTTA